MNFQDLKKIEGYQFYLDTAFNKASNRVDNTKQTGISGDRLQKSKHIESLRITIVRESLVTQLQKIIDGFPQVDELPVFYAELLKCTLDHGKLKKSLGSVQWAIQRIESIYRKYNGLILRCQDIRLINGHRREFYGRISSVLKQIKPFFIEIDQARKIMKSYPAIKTSLPTIALVGFPNVGKTTMLSKLTGSTPAINSYAFTTIGVNIGYIGKKKEDRIQVLDTPGTLNRFNKMNNIEKMAYLAMEHVGDVFIYVFDLTETSYPLKDQQKLYKRIHEFKKPVVPYITKTDITPKEDVDKFLEKINAETDLNKLLERAKQKMPVK